MSRKILIFIGFSIFCLLGAGCRSGGISPDGGVSHPKPVQRSNEVGLMNTVSPRWLPDNSRFWYRLATASGTNGFVLVDAETGQVKRASTAKNLGLAEEGHRFATSRMTLHAKRTVKTGDDARIRFFNSTTNPVSVFWVNEQGVKQAYGPIPVAESIEYKTYAGHVWLVADEMGDPMAYCDALEGLTEIDIDGMATNSGHRRGFGTNPDPNTSPDGKYSMRISEKELVMVSKDGTQIPITLSCLRSNVLCGPGSWSPDSRHCVMLAVQTAPTHWVTVIESSPKGRVQPIVKTFSYYKPGDELPQVCPVLVDAATGTARIISSDLFTNAFTPDARLNIRWAASGGEFYFDYNRRGHQLYRIMAVNATNGVLRTIVEEQSATFVDYTEKTWRHWLDDSGEMLWMSERDGWAHLWLYDVVNGTVKNLVTRGDWVVREVLHVDSKKRQVWFLAGGVRAGESPYHRHLCRVNFDGTGFIRLTQGDGDHQVEFSPDRRWFVDRYSRVDLPPVTELRRADDGLLVCELERGDASGLVESGWTMPERFVAKGRDGKTDIYGVIIKPSHFDPARKYPVVEEVYAGPHDSFAPVGFGMYRRQHEIAERGFVVVQSDGMGTDNRGKAFHDVCWKNLKDAGFPDRIAWIKAAGRARPWMDLSRVGIFGGSAGGQTAMRALLDHHDFYTVAVADCGCHDNRMDKIWWNEQWLGWPVDDSYIRNSNVEDAANLKGSLLLIVGELDNNVDPASTLQVVNALQKADKDFEFIILTGVGHGAAETPYGSRRRMDFLVRHLQAKEGRL